MLDAEQLKLARDKLEQLARPVELRVSTGPDPEDRFAKALVEVTGLLAEAAPEKVKVVQVEAHGPTDRPSLQMENIEYLAVPLDQELEPFLDVLGYLAGGSELQPGSVSPARLEVLIATTCPNCPTAVRACGKLAAALPTLEVVIVDVQYFTELAGSCRSVPTVIIDGGHTVVGPVSARQLLELLKQRDEPGYVARALGSMIEAGRLQEMAPLLRTTQGQAAMATVMQDGTMQQKMGLMLAVEQVLELNPHEMDASVPHLLPLLGSSNATVRGDVADLLGRIGAPGARDALTRLLEDDNPDVREVAEEAIEQLRDPS